MPRTRSKSAVAVAAPPRTPCTCGSLRRASRRISQLYDAALAPLGLKATQYAILSELERAGGIPMRELAAAMVMDRSTLGHNLRPLQRDGLVVLRLAKGDRRKRHVELTSRGGAALRRAKTLWRRAEGHFERVFGKREAADLRTILLSIAANEQLTLQPAP
jgi:DNA-binding MarR family transcriptional regulator